MKCIYVPVTLAYVLAKIYQVHHKDQQYTDFLVFSVFTQCSGRIKIGDIALLLSL